MAVGISWGVASPAVRHAMRNGWGASGRGVRRGRNGRKKSSGTACSRRRSESKFPFSSGWFKQTFLAFLRLSLPHHAAWLSLPSSRGDGSADLAHNGMKDRSIPTSDATRRATLTTADTHFLRPETPACSSPCREVEGENPRLDATGSALLVVDAAQLSVTEARLP